jgi:hypothetical protein
VAVAGDGSVYVAGDGNSFFGNDAILKKETVAWPDASSGPATCEMKIRGDGTGVEIKQRLGK